jgi:two-component system response regulator AtoC
MSAQRILLIEDEAAARQVLADVLGKAGYPVETAADAAGAAARLARGDVDVALCDVHLPDGNGIDLLRQSRSAGLETTFLMVTAFASVETAVEALRAGAYDYIVKPVRHAELLHRLAQIEAVSGLREENRTLRRAVREGKPLYRFASEAMRRIERMADKVAPTDSTVLISGESGTGKSLIARSIHERSNRSDGPFLAINCGAIPEQLLENEFFGHAKGAFTSADRERKGLFLEVDHGTLFLDEIGELPLHMQTKLLHVIEDKQVRPLGSGRTRQVDARIVAATNRNLVQLVGEGRFREDLYFRLSMFEIAIPPLRERPDDIRGLIRFMLLANGRNRAQGRDFGLDPEAEELLNRHSWPGNVRELENVITRACILSDGDAICVDDLPVELVRAAGRGAAAEACGTSLREQRRRFETAAIKRAIEEAEGDRRIAAMRLQISLSSLYAKLSEEAEPEADGSLESPGAAPAAGARAAAP